MATGSQAEPTRAPVGSVSLLTVENLKVAFDKGGRRLLPVIDAVNLELGANQAMGVVGESGSGKTMLCRSIVGTLARRGARVTAGRILFEGRDLAEAPESVWRTVRGKKIGYVPQSSLAGLNPVLSIETQLIESITVVRPIGRDEAVREALRLLDMVRIPRARAVLRERSSHLSGGMRQRVMIAAALAQSPRLLVADEPTTALDVTVQHEILELIGRLRAELGMALILVSHDLAVVEEVCDSVMVMYAGATVESGPVDDVTHRPRHPYSRALHVSRVDTASPGDDIETIAGEPPTVGRWPSGCRFWPRCPIGDDACRTGAQPGLTRIGSQWTACLYPGRMGRA
jgi:oligopeptide/dipeptide ABC transporter ATP-binding protein